MKRQLGCCANGEHRDVMYVANLGHGTGRPFHQIKQVTRSTHRFHVDDYVGPRKCGSERRFDVIGSCVPLRDARGF